MREYRTYSFKLYRTKRDKRLREMLWIASQVHNHCVALHRRYYTLYKKHLNLSVLQKHLAKLKQLPRYAHWKKLGSQAVQDVAIRIEKGYKRFIDNLKSKSKRRVGKPTFKAARKYKSFTLTQAGWKLLGGNRIRISNQTYKFSKSREIDGVIKTLTVKRDTLGDLYLFFSVEIQVQPYLPTTGNSAGFDFGLKTFLTSSDNEQILSPLFFRQGASVIRRANRALSNKIKGSNHRKAARRNLARVHQRVANRRKDFQFKLARRLVSQYDALFFEDLNLDGMKRLYGRKVSDLAFYSFLKIVEHYAKSNGKRIGYVGRFYPSSKTCNVCGQVVKELPLSVRHWTCEACGTAHDRDLNAAKNLLREGASSLGRDSVKPNSLVAVACIPESHEP